MDAAEFDGVHHYGTDDSSDLKSDNVGASVKQETLDKDASATGEVKKEPPLEEAAGKKLGAEEFTGRSTRKRKLNSMAETSDFSDESADENYTKTPTRKRGASAGRPRGRPRKSTGEVPTNQADPSRNPRIVLKNIASVSQEDLHTTAASEDVKPDTAGTKAARGGRRGRPGRTAAAKAPARPSNRGKSRASKGRRDEEEEEEEEEDDEDDNGEVDFGEDVEDDDEDEDFVPKKGKASRSTKQAFRTRGKGKGKSKPKPDTENEEEEEDEEEDEDEEGTGAAEDGTEVNPNAVKTGQYLIEKSDMRHLENYPIWRMEGPNMLRKFEMIVQDGAVRHKSLYAYSSWAQSMGDLYEKIQVKNMSSQEGESIVEIIPECLPAPPDYNSLESRYCADELLPLYNIYVEAMFRQAVDSNFLKRIKSDNDAHYVNAIKHIDGLIRDKISNIENEVSMKEEFKSRVRNCPNMKSIRRQNWSQTDQATTNKSMEKGVRSVLMFGYGYDPFLMEEDKSKGVEVAQEVVVGSTMEHYLAAYHGLIHFKYTLLRRCQDKAKLINALESGGGSNVLDRCLRDRAWILQTFEDLKNLLTNENLS